jgi:hypothetical protein
MFYIINSSFKVLKEFNNRLEAENALLNYWKFNFPSFSYYIIENNNTDFKAI